LGGIIRNFHLNVYTSFLVSAIRKKIILANFKADRKKSFFRFSPSMRWK